ncbi:MAG TPA: SBBP repeat-containing protein [Bryobacteraceae bacterium]|nr:SBBP repeat-containing protein [Bryobacteraceae bacterium]
MLAGFREIIRKNVFAIALWTAVGALLLISTFRPASRQALGFSTGGGSGPEIEPCQILADIDDYFCGDDLVAATPQANNIRFEPNVGQVDAGYEFVAHGRGQSILLAETEMVFELKGPKKLGPREIHATLEGARSGLGSSAEAPLSGRVNYLIGSDPKNWHTDIPTFARVRFPGVYPHVDVVYHGAGGELENDFVVQPGGDPESIRILFSGADGAEIGADGSLTIHADQRSLVWKKPLLYQYGAHGMRVGVEGYFKTTADGAIGFEVGVYDLKKALVIDPQLTYATYFGSPDTEAAGRVVADNSGNAYLVGGTDDQGFPSTPGTFVTAASGLQGNVLVAKLASDGKTMVYETHIGGSNGDSGYGIAIDASGDVYLAGMTASADYPVTPAANNYTTKNITDPMNCFVTELNAGGNGLVYSALLGGSQADGCSSVGVDASGNTWVAGVTDSTDLKTVNAIQTSAPGALFGTASYAAFMVKLAPGGSSVLYSSYYGGPGNTAATSLALDSNGNVYLTGFTTSSLFSTTSGAFQTTFGGSGGQTNSIFTTGDAFVMKLNSSGQRVYATYLGGAKDDVGVGIAVDSSGDAYVGGATLSGNFPTQNAFQSTNHGAGGSAYASGGDGFIAELDPTGSTLLFSSYIGGTEDDRVLGVALDSSNNIYLAGHTISQNFPTAGAQAQSGYAGDNSGVFKTGDAFVAEVSGTSHTLTFSTYLGGSGGDWAGGVAIDGQGGIIIVGGTNSSNFPATQGAYQTAYAGADSYMAGVPAGDAFIAKFGGSAAAAVSLAGISNAASYAGGAIAPGEAVLIAGSGIGPATLAGAQCTTSACSSLATTVAKTQFTFNGTPAPIVYVSSQYSSVIVPYEVAASSTAQVVATVNGVASPPLTVKVAPALPGIFSANSSGSGAAAVFNQPSGSLNSPQNPAAPGSIITLYLTGEGQTVPPGVDGLVTTSLNIQPALSPVTVLFGSVPATSYQYVGEAPGVVAGVMQINVYVPALAPTGGSVPLVVNVGSYSTQTGITVAIQ